MTVPGAPTSAPQPLAAAAAASRDPLGRCRRRRRPPRLKTPERASAPPHNRTAPPSAVRPGTRERKAAAPPLPRPCPASAPPLIHMLARPGARSRSLEGGECGSERRVPVRPISCPAKRKDPLGRRAAGPRGVRAGRARARMGVSTRGKGGRFGGNGPSLRGVCAKPAPGLPSPPQLQSYRARCPASFRSPLPHPRSREARPQG